MKILMPVDGSAHTKHMLSYVAAHDELLGRTHQILFVTVVTPVPVYVADFLDRATCDGHYREQAERVLEPVRAFARQKGWSFDTAYRVGAAADQVVEYATAEKAELIVMGTHGHTALGNLVLGSVVNGVLARCKLPLLLVR